MGNCTNSTAKYALSNSTLNNKPPPPPSWIGAPTVVTGKHNPTHRVMLSPHQNGWGDIEFVKVLGRGKFGEVVLCQHADDSKFYAVKKISKKQMVERKNKESVKQEIISLLQTSHPFIAHMFGYFQDEKNVNLILEFCSGGELYNRMKRRVKFTNDEAKFYFTEIILALKYLHSKPLSLVYRDLKPENCMIDSMGHMRLVDFGFSAPIAREENLTGGCGTAMYIAPEIASGHNDKAHGFPVDWWASGIMLYEFLTGRAPFGDSSELTKFEILNNINAGKIKWPGTISKDARNLIQNLLVPNPEKRWKFSNIEESEWMAGVNYSNFLLRKVIPPWIPPHSETEGDVSNFLDWKEIPEDKNFINTDYAHISESIYNNELGGSDGVVVCAEAYNKALAERKPSDRQPPDRKQKEGNTDNPFAATAGAVNMLKKRSKSLRKNQSDRKQNKDTTPTKTKDMAKQMLRKGSSKKDGSIKAGSFSQTAGAVNLAKKRIKSQGSSKGSKIHAK
ncbi:hypothetical protein TL16_g03553 [Triparma laevis f. inornata]|uniref:Protein kinase domain-containing protein n=1 Tax=Triparma laevis f. inornata TaxID=1714386 RepID=A0A9W7A7J9_9STRA|nr:hypothetical protein TL16_g03553 [Triparma laevis f. inornata]